MHSVTWFSDHPRHSDIGYPERFVSGPPALPRLPVAAWINKPLEEVMSAQ